jgi:hypothetical protein
MQELAFLHIETSPEDIGTGLQCAMPMHKQVCIRCRAACQVGRAACHPQTRNVLVYSGRGMMIMTMLPCLGSQPQLSHTIYPDDASAFCATYRSSCIDKNVYPWPTSCMQCGCHQEPAGASKRTQLEVYLLANSARLCIGTPTAPPNSAKNFRVQALPGPITDTPDAQAHMSTTRCLCCGRLVVHRAGIGKLRSALACRTCANTQAGMVVQSK